MEEAERENEIHQIQQDLRNLQRRYGALERSARRMRIFFHILVYGSVVGLFAGLILHNPAALFSSGLILIVVGVFALVFRNNRWIDIVSGPATYGVRYIEAHAVEDMVAERMERLSRLRGNYK